MEELLPHPSPNVSLNGSAGCHSSMDFVEDDQGSQILTKLRKQRSDDKYCDMVLRVGGRVFKAHRNVLAACSPYFDTMCNSGLEEDIQAVADMSCTSAEGMELILDYMYTGRITLTADNVECILRGAEPFLMANLKNYCHKFLWQNMNAANCLVVRHLADLYGFKELHQRACKFIRNQFVNVVQDSIEDILLLSQEEILGLITDDKIRVEKEESIYELVIRWAQMDPERVKHLPQLLSHVRLSQLDRSYLKDVVEKEPLVTGNSECLKLLADALHQTDTTRRSYCSDSPVLKPRKGRLTDVVVITGGVSDQGPLENSFGYIIDEDRWTMLPGLPDELRFHAVAVLNSCLYAAGGSSSSLVSNSVHCYDPMNNSWSTVASLQTPREYMSMVECNGCLYAMGGIRWDCLQQSVERYDPDVDQWSFVSQMPTKRYSMQLVTLSNRYIYAISGRDASRRPVSTVERYDIQTDEWTILPDIPIPQGDQPWEFPIVEAYDNKIFVTDLATKSFSLDAVRNKWSEEACNFGPVASRACLQYCTMEKNVFVFEGCNACIFNRKLGLWSNITPPPVSTLASACCVLQVPYEFLGKT
ncbi:kelch-like protein 12 [Acanthaster planci]|uniref:Kelch-like protein 12 n=1 Tax=Acanthaster planci TaxID=133434 RepID=A0A8B7YMK0_ACAPL|nr:kelch-like protein 12 [Acanthaster planci]XP_022094490.1 kelch-like protein 12 [Acanthaster planci]